MDLDRLETLVAVGNDQQQLELAQDAAAKALRESGLPPFPTNACGATLSALLQQAGVEVPMTLGAGRLARRLGGPGASRSWARIAVGEQRAGDVGVCFDNFAPEGADHIYLVAETLGEDRMMIADNQSPVVHERFASGQGRTPTDYFLRPSDAAATGLMPAKGTRKLLLLHDGRAFYDDEVREICTRAENSSLAAYHWPHRGPAPIGYVQGMAVAYAILLGKLAAADAAALEMARPESGDAKRDALSWYAAEFAALGLADTSSGVETLRKTFLLLYGLGIQESSGRHCEGRDQNATNTDSETAEAGLFQASFNARAAHPLMKRLFNQYAGREDLLPIFERGMNIDPCKPEDWLAHGTGDGKTFQDLSKKCPLFAIEFAGVGVRNTRRHWGTLNDRSVLLSPRVVEVLGMVEEIVDRRGPINLFLSSLD